MRNKWFSLTVVLATLIAILCLLPALSAPAQGAVAVAPPPTWTVGPPPTKTPIGGPSKPAHKPPPGGFIELRVQFPGAIAYPWQELWTVVQWQDRWGTWRHVEGWQGTLDKVADGVGVKTWWVDESHLGRGPFRWRVYRAKGGWLVVQSEAFTLPAEVNQRVEIEVALSP